MNLTKLFDMQHVLDQRIMDKHPELKGQGNLDWKVLALQVELGECANEHRGFKKWSNDQEPRTAWKQPSYRGGYIERNLLLEEYVDCLHFILSIGIELGFTDIEIWGSPEESATKQFLKCFHQIDSLSFIISNNWYVSIEVYENLFGTFVELGKTLGFTWEQIEEAYFEKNEINHIRQEQGY